ncbi:unnamed protein product [Oikopleura dioica]|uniref:C-type lectin domain-containing protein n=1 Tax=Oikopleura dioica TaxID=34765 RepID=E4XJ60_OIKDI|nr:unnamed protein product [Oikopleura dioica]
MHTNSSILRVQKETIKNLENAIQQLVKNFENLNSNKYAFHFVDKYMDWNNATEYCNSFDMFLAYFDNQSELDEYFRLSRIVTRDIQQRWIDGTSQGRRRLDYLFKGKISPPWGAYQPTGQYGSEIEECVALYTTFGWENEVANDMNCARKQPFACRENF